MKKGIIFLAALSLFACATVTPKRMPAETLSALKGRHIAVSVQETPGFVVMTPGAASAGLLIGGVGYALTQAIAYENGAEIVRTHGLVDPASALGERVAQSLGQKFGLVLVAGAKTPRNGENADEPVTALPGKDLLVEVATLDWAMVTMAPKWGKYRASYSARVRLVDAQADTVLAEGGCQFKPERYRVYYSYDEMLVNDAMLLKQRLASYAQQCADDFIARQLTLEQGRYTQRF